MQHVVQTVIRNSKARLRGRHLAGLLVILAAAMLLCWMNRPWFAGWVDQATLPAARATYNLNDYAAFVNAARMILAGHGPDLYNIEAQRAAELRDWSARFDPQLAVPFVNPPWFAVALLPLAPLPMGVGFLIWLAVCCALILSAAALLARWARPPPLVGVAFVLSVAGFVPFWRTAILGQTSALVLFGLAWGIVSVAEGRARRGGLALALVGVKPQLLILPVLALLMERRRKALFWCVSASLALVAVTLPIIGLGAIPDYLALMRSAAYAGYENLPQMQSWRALIEGTLGLRGSTATMLNLAGMLAGLGLVVWAWWEPARTRWAGGPRNWTRLIERNPVQSDPNWDLRMALTILATQLFTPHMHVHDLLIWIVPGGLLLHHLYAPGAAWRMGRRRRTIGFVSLWAGYLVVWPAWLWPDARLALWFSLLVCGWLVVELRAARQERAPAWARTATT